MYRSLYQTIKSKVDAKESGVIKLLNTAGQTGAIFLENGLLTAIVQGEDSGADAADIIFRWVNVAVMFMEGESPDAPQEKPPNTSAVMEQLKKIDERVAISKKLIGGCDTVFKFVGHKIAGAQKFTSKELGVSFLLDGTNSIKSVLQKSELNELDLFWTVCKLLKTGLLKEIKPHQPLAEDQRSAFIGQLENILSEITGPVASVIISDAFDAVDISPEELAECDISFLFSVVSFYLDDDEKEAFSQWVEAYPL